MLNTNLEYSFSGIKYERGSCFDSLLEKISNDNYKCFSFDFFDTVCFRLVKKPTDIFLFVGEELAKKRILVPFVSPYLFKKIRIEAEARARRRFAEQGGGSTEVSLVEIYNEMPDIFNNTAIYELIDLECCVETNHLVINRLLVDIISEIQSRGKKIIIVSDTYFSKKDVHSFISKNFEPDDIFCSSDYRIGKGSGLFKTVLDHLKLPPSNVIHIGDNYHADCEAPGEIGIPSLLFYNGTGTSWELIREEDELVTHGAPDTYLMQDKYDSSLTSLRNNALRFCLPDQISHFSWGTFVLGPIVSSFICWVHASHGKDIDCLFGIMREGGFLTKIYENLFSEQLQNLSLSRKVLKIAQLHPISTEKLITFCDSRTNFTAASFLDLFNLHIPQQEVPFRLNLPLADDKSKKKFFDYIINNETIKQKIDFFSKDMRAKILKHIKMVLELQGYDLNNNTKKITIGLIDVGYNATVQGLLQNIIDESNLNIKFIGYYLMTNANIVSKFFSNVYSNGYLLNAGGIGEASDDMLLRNLEILEQCLTPENGTLRGFTSHGDPLEEVNMIPTKQRNEIASVQDGIINFSLFVKKNNICDLISNNASQLLKNIFLRSMTFPAEKEITLFKDWVHDDNTFSKSILEEIINFNLSELIDYSTPKNIQDIGMRSSYWKEGLVCSVNSKIIKQSALSTFYKIDHTLFTTSAPFYCEIRQTNGDLKSEKLERQLELNVSGKSFFQVDVLPTILNLNVLFHAKVPQNIIKKCPVDMIILVYTNSSYSRITKTLYYDDFKQLWSDSESALRIFLNDLLDENFSNLTIYFCINSAGCLVAKRTTEAVCIDFDGQDIEKYDAIGCIDVVGSSRAAMLPNVTITNASGKIYLAGWIYCENIISADMMMFVRVYNKADKFKVVFPGKRVNRKDVTEKYSLNSDVECGIESWLDYDMLLSKEFNIDILVFSKNKVGVFCSKQLFRLI